MKITYIRKYFILIHAICLIFIFNGHIYGYDKVKNDNEKNYVGNPLKQKISCQDSLKDKILILSSYNIGITRVNNFINDFQNQVFLNGSKYDVIVSDMSRDNLKGNQSLHYKIITKIILNKKEGKLKAVVLIGQEAWSSFNYLYNYAPNLQDFDIPVFPVLASNIGVDISYFTCKKNKEYVPESINYVDSLCKKGLALGGELFTYDLDKNIEVIKKIYPGTKSVAFMSDNTYGGVSMLAYVSKEMKKHEDLNFISLDIRKFSDKAAVADTLKKLDDNTVIILGCWRMDRLGNYLSGDVLSKLIKENTKLPVFTLSGNGMSNLLAIGGYFSDYNIKADYIYNQIDMYQHHYRKIEPKILGMHYHFNGDKLDKLGFKKYDLPYGSIVESSNEHKIASYKHIIRKMIISFIILLIFMMVIIITYLKNLKLKKSILEENKKLAAQTQRAKDSERMKTAFLANMSHEIRTPLNSIVGFATILSDDEINTSASLLPEERKNFGKIIKSNSLSLLRIINDILDTSRMETGKTKFDIKSYDVVAICKDVFLTVFHDYNNPDIKTIFTHNLNEYRLKTDKTRLIQLIINLLNNAKKFTEEGTITLSLDIFEDKNMVQISVTDTGIGIAKDKQKIIFGRFERIDENKEGYGLGLVICDQIIQRLGGKIYVDSDYTDGARFIVEHPLK